LVANRVLILDAMVGIACLVRAVLISVSDWPFREEGTMQVLVLYPSHELRKEFR